jgi:hypothetical protein
VVLLGGNRLCRPGDGSHDAKLVSKLKNLISLVDTQSYNMNRGYSKTFNYVLPRSSPGQREAHPPNKTERTKKCICDYMILKGEK